MLDHWEMLDVWKALLAVVAGVILGAERELKDKAAGLKTISVICLGSALFSIISYKLGGADHETTRIASYIVSGVGFLGAGVIFKDGVNVSGLTTAGIIWLAAAIGTAIGFGEFYLAATFLGASLLLIYTSPILARIFKPRKQTRTLTFTIAKVNTMRKDEIFAQLKQYCYRVEEKKMDAGKDHVTIVAEVVAWHKRLSELEEYLLKHELIQSFSL